MSEPGDIRSSRRGSCWEKVHTVDDWYDGPRAGVADFRGAPHYYRSLWRDEPWADVDADHFELTPLCAEGFKIRIELTAIWQRWRDSYSGGPVQGEMVLPADRQRKRELEPPWVQELQRRTPDALIARGRFQMGSNAVAWGRAAPAPERDMNTAVLASRRAWFHGYFERLDAQPTDVPLRCPCCSCRTVEERGSYDICPVCFWEDDGQDDYDADLVRGGPNHGLSLTEARANYRRIGACDEGSIPHVRPPRPEELPEHASPSDRDRSASIAALRMSVRSLVTLLVARRYDDAVARCASSRLTSTDLRRVIAEYGRTLTELPRDALYELDAVPVTTAATPTWSVRAPLWTAEEGRSDLSLELTVTVASDRPRVELDDLRVP